MKIGTGYCYRTPLLPFNFNSIFLFVFQSIVDKTHTQTQTHKQRVRASRVFPNTRMRQRIARNFQRDCFVCNVCVSLGFLATLYTVIYGHRSIRQRYESRTNTLIRMHAVLYYSVLFLRFSLAFSFFSLLLRFTVTLYHVFSVQHFEDFFLRDTESALTNQMYKNSALNYHSQIYRGKFHLNFF